MYLHFPHIRTLWNLQKKNTRTYTCIKESEEVQVDLAEMISSASLKHLKQFPIKVIIKAEKERIRRNNQATRSYWKKDGHISE